MGFNIVMGIFGWLLAVGPSLVAGTLVAGMLENSLGTNADTLYGPVFSVSGTLFNMLFLPIQVGAWTLIYYDLRVRTEAFDLVLQAASEPERANRWVFLPPFEKWISGDDVGRFLLTSILLIAFFALIYILPTVLFMLAVLVGSVLSG
jgi:hypothetical protein